MKTISTMRKRSRLAVAENETEMRGRPCFKSYTIRREP